MALDKIYIGLPKKLVLEGIYVEDKGGDTLLNGGSLRADISLLKLLRSEVEIGSLELNDVTAKIKRQLPDTVYNFQFIIDAFAPAQSNQIAKKNDTGNLNISIRSVALNNIHFIYKDVITGSDVAAQLDHFDTRISHVDASHLSFAIPETHVNGLTVNVNQYKPLLKNDSKQEDSIAAQQPIALQLQLDALDLKNISFNYSNDVSATYFTVHIGDFEAHPRNIDLSNRTLDLGDIALNNTVAIVALGNKTEAAIVKKEVRETAEAQVDAGWNVRASNLHFTNNSFRFDDSSKSRVANGVDYAHLNVTGITLNVANAAFQTDSIRASVKQLAFEEQSGLALQQFHGDFVYTGTRVALSDFYAQTPGTVLQRNMSARFASIDALQRSPASMQLDVDISDSKVALQDVLLFMPSLASNKAVMRAGQLLYVNAQLRGRLSDLAINQLKIDGLRDTHIDIAGHVRGMPDVNKTNGTLAIRTLSSSRRDVELLVPPGTLPNTITLPERFTIIGSLSGTIAALIPDLTLRTTLGNASVRGSLSNITDPVRARYDLVLKTTDLDVGTLINNRKMLGPVTATVTARGNGFDPKTANAHFDGAVQSAVISQYAYRDAHIIVSIASHHLVLNGRINDPNLSISLDGTGTFSDTYPAVQLTALIDSIKTQPLHFTTDDIAYHGKIIADFANTNPDSLVGNLFITESVLVQNARRITVDTIGLVAGHSDSGQYLQLFNEAVYAKLQGRYKLTELGSVFQHAVQPYFNIAATDSSNKISPYDFTINARVFNKPVLKTFMPGLERMDSLALDSRFTTGNGWSASLVAPSIDINGSHIRGFAVQAGTGTQGITAKAAIEQISSGTSLAIYNTTLDATLFNNIIDYALNIRDRVGKDKYHVNGIVRQPQPGKYALTFRPTGLLLNYDHWTIDTPNQVIVAPTYISASQFTLRHSAEEMSISSTLPDAPSPLLLRFSQFRLATLTGFVQTDSTLADGILNGNIRFNDVLKDPIFAGNLTITDLSIRKDTVGNLVMQVNNNTPSTYAADITLTGRGNDLKIDGSYMVRPRGKSAIDLLLDIRTLPMSTIEAVSNGTIRYSTGSLNGKFNLKGALTEPEISGKMNFDKTGFNVSTLNNYFRIDQESFVVDNQGIHFNKFKIKDSANNELVLNGDVATTNFKNYRFDLTVRAENFQALNSTKQDNNLFYGKLFFNADLAMKGNEQRPVVDGRLTVNEKTKMTVVLPQEEPVVVQRNGVIEFVDKDNPATDSLFLVESRFDSLNNWYLQGMDVSVNLQVNKEADFSLVIDAGNGDFLNVRGDASISAGIDPSGKINFSGSYELEQGTYDLTFNFLHRRFLIDKGSKIVWAGEPTDADVNITAKYIANTAPLDLVKNQLENATANDRNRYLQKLPFEVYLTMTGKLLQPTFSFNIVLPENRSYIVGNDIITNVRNQLEVLRQEPGEMNKQVFSLLLLNRFTAENPFASSGEGPTANTLARQSVSKLLTEQLNRLAEDLIQGVNLNFDVVASEDYTSGARRDRTDLNVALSKQLLNDRLTVSVGSNFQLEGPQNSNQQASNILGNIALNYRLSKDGRYVLRAYRKNDYEGVIDGYIIETGVSFIITVDYNRFSQIFRKRKRNRTQPAESQAPPIDASTPKTNPAKQ